MKLEERISLTEIEAKGFIPLGFFADMLIYGKGDDRVLLKEANKDYKVHFTYKVKRESWNPTIKT